MDSKMHEEAVHLASHLAGRGFQTRAVVNSMLLNQNGLERGFQQLKYVPFVQGNRKSSPVTDPAIEMLRQRDRSKPLFAMVHYMDVHSDYMSLPKYEKLFVRPYDGYADGTTQQLYRFAAGQFDLDQKDAAHLLDLYDAGIRQVDDEVERLLDFLRKDGLLDESLLVILSDHGEEFLEHGSVLHGHTQFQEVVRVPLIFRGPGLPAGKRVETPVSLIDVMPTSLDYLDLSAPGKLDGVSLRGLWREPAARLEARLLYFEADVVFPPPGPGTVPVGPYRAVRDDRFKLHLDLDTGNVGLFDLAKDPGETVNVIADHSDRAKKLWVELKRFLGDGGP
jgi:arylsulfatase A-like enzyme